MFSAFNSQVKKTIDLVFFCILTVPTIGNATDTLTIPGNLTVQGTRTIINTDELNVRDKLVGIGSTATPSTLSQDGSGIIIYGKHNVDLKYEVSKAAIGVNTAFCVSGFVTAFGGVRVGSAITLHTNGNLGITGVMTASSYVGDGSNLTGVSAGEFFGNSVGVSTSKNVGIHTTNVNTEKIVGAANSFVGLYMGDGFIGFPTSLNRNGGYFIATTVNALSAGPVSLGSTMTLHGTWVIV